jgi:hypothetical protein
VAQVVLLVTLSLLLGFTPVLAEIAEPLGWTAQALLLLLVSLGLYRYRFAWLLWGRESPVTERLGLSIAGWRERVFHAGEQPDRSPEARERRPALAQVGRPVSEQLGGPAHLPAFAQEEAGSTAPEDRSGTMELAREMEEVRQKLGRTRLPALSVEREGSRAVPSALLRTAGSHEGGPSAEAAGGHVRDGADRSRPLHLFRNH